MKIMADDGKMYIGYILKQELKIYAHPPDKNTDGKAFYLHLRFTNGCGSMEDVLSTDCVAYQEHI